jgi:hypothetical protein
MREIAREGPKDLQKERKRDWRSIHRPVGVYTSSIPAEKRTQKMCADKNTGREGWGVEGRRDQQSHLSTRRAVWEKQGKCRKKWVCHVCVRALCLAPPLLA